METELLFDVPPSCFIPQPKVTSSVIRLRRRTAHPAETTDEQFLFKVIRAAFNQRRKTLINAISSQIPGVSKEQAERAVTESGFDARIRGETLDIGKFATIADKLAAIISADL